MKTKGFIIVCDEEDMDIMINLSGRSNNTDVPGSSRIYGELYNVRTFNSGALSTSPLPQEQRTSVLNWEHEQ